MPVTSYTYGVQFIGNKIWTCLNYSQILMTATMGQNWAWQHYSPYLKDIAWSDPLTGWAVAGSNVQTDHWCYKSTDAGQSWATDPQAPGGAAVSFLGHDYGWMLYEGNAGKVFRTVNGGSSWSQANVGTGNWTGGMFFATPDSGWVFGSNGNLRISSNGGASWSPQNVGSSNYVETVFFINSEEGWAGGGYGGGNGFIAHTTDGGASWNMQGYPGTDHVLKLFFLDANTGWASSYGGKVFKTSNGGQSWTFAGQVAQSAAQEMLFISQGTGWLAANSDASGGFKGNIYKTTDGGGTWNLEYSCPWNNSTIEALAIQSDNLLWACGGHATILKYEISVGMESRIENAPGLYCYPNPSEGPVTISLKLSKAGEVCVALYNTTGMLVAEIHKGQLQAGSHSFKIDYPLPSGVYLLSLKSDSGRLIEKIVLTR